LPEEKASGSCGGGKRSFRQIFLTKGCLFHGSLENLKFTLSADAFYSAEVIDVKLCSLAGLGNGSAFSKFDGLLSREKGDPVLFHGTGHVVSIGARLKNDPPYNIASGGK
jgi:hypothetical protein